MTVLQHGVLTQQIPIAAYYLLMVGVPDDELVVRGLHRVHLVNVHLFARSTSSGTITDLTQTGYLTHRVRTLVRSDVVDEVVCLVRRAKKVSLQFLYQKLPVNGRNDWFHKRLFLHVLPIVWVYVNGQKWRRG